MGLITGFYYFENDLALRPHFLNCSNHFQESLSVFPVKMSSPTALIIPAVTKHTATVIMAHGLGDSGAGWASLAENWRRRQKFQQVKFIFPNAPNIPISVVSSPPAAKKREVL